MGPANTSSYSLQDICNRLETGAAGTQRNFTEPSSGPADSADCTLNEVMEKAPAVTGEAAEPDDVATGTKYWGLTGGEWGLKTGTSTAVDTSSGNATANEIRKGKKAWADGKEVVGTSTAVDTSSGDATANEIKEGKIAWADGKEVIGTSTAVDTGSGNATANEIKEGKIAWADGKEIVGTSTAVDTSSGNATADDIREGKIAWVDGKQVVGLAIIPSRYTKNNDGTVTDNRTGLVWLEDVDCINRQSWQAAMNEAKSLKTGQCNLTDGSEKNDWRLPTKEEWEMMVDTLFRGPALSNTSTLSRLY